MREQSALLTVEEIPRRVRHYCRGRALRCWLRVLVLMWFLVRIDMLDDSWDLVIIGGYDNEHTCRTEQARSVWGQRALCVRATTPSLLSEPILVPTATDHVEGQAGPPDFSPLGR